MLKLHLLLGGDLSQGNCFGDQLSFYYPGVGTYGNWFEKLRNSFSAPPHEDVGDIIKQALRDLYQNYRPGDKLFVFGFSRGAAIARRFAAVLNDIYAAYNWEEAPRITFMGVFDTVAALKKPNLFNEKIKPASDVVFEDGTISPLVEKALHLLSLDERRIAFMPTLMNRDSRVTEVWLAGAHSDVGGGYRYDGLSDHALEFMINFIENDAAIPLTFMPPAAIDFAELFEGGKQYIDLEDVILMPKPIAGKNHEQGAITDLKEQFLDYRSPRVNVNDKHSVFPPLIHRSVFDRMALDHNYAPKALSAKLLNPYTGMETAIRVWEYDGSDNDKEVTIAQAKTSSVEKLKARTLDIGHSAQFQVFANLKYNRSGIVVKPDEAYSFTLDMGQKWYDASIECGPAGWDRNKESLDLMKKFFIGLMEGHKRHPDAAWFEVIGTIAQNDLNCFRVLEHLAGKALYQPQAAGELFFFANDLHGKYGNNYGTVTVTIKREG